MASRRLDLCPNTQEELLAEREADGTSRGKRDECPYCVYLIGAHNKASAAAAAPSALKHASVRVADPVAESKEEPAQGEEDACRICLEPLWSAADGNCAKPGCVADLSCGHLMHSKCLAEHTRREVEEANTSGVAANGWGAFGPRGSCPVCHRPLSIWISVKSRWMSKQYWIRQIQRVLIELGPQQRGGDQLGREWQQVCQELVNQRCENLSASDLTSATQVMLEACKKEGRVLQHINGVDEEGDPTLTICSSDGFWDYHEDTQRLWLRAWGPVRRMQVASRGRGGHGRR